MKKGEIVDLEVQDIVFGGKGISKIDDFVIFTENTIPGDILKARITKKKQAFAEARPVEFIKRGNGYVEAECKYFGNCGGCKWQNLAYNKQLEYKTKQVLDNIERIGKIEKPKILDTIGSDDIFAYRNKMEFSFSDNRWLLPEELGDMSIPKNFALGFHVPKAYNKIIDIDYCYLQDEIFNKILIRFSEFVKKSELPIYNLKSHEGVWRFLMIRKGVHTNEYMINLVSSEPVKEQIQGFVQELVKEIPEIKSVVNNLNRRKAQIAIGEEEVLIYGSQTIHESLGEYTFEISANSFFQTNTKQAEKMYQIVKEYAALTGNETVIDLYSGTGTIPIYLSSLAKKVIGMEIVESAVDNAKENAKRFGIENIEFFCGDVKDLLKEKTELKADVLIIDPPRAGMHPSVLENVVKLSAKKIVYVSCNPSTLARDLETLKESYELLEVQPLDMFPHTYHIEAIALLTIKDSL